MDAAKLDGTELRAPPSNEQVFMAALLGKLYEIYFAKWNTPLDVLLAGKNFHQIAVKILSAPKQLLKAA